MAARLTDDERRLRAITEAAYQSQILQLAELRGWKRAHFHDSRRQVKPGVFVGDKDAKGFPDLVLGRKLPRPDLIVWEVKKEKGVVTPEQEEWLDIINACGITACVVRPSNWDYVQDRLK